MEYPKINSLYKREGCGAYDEGKKRYVSDLEKRPRKSPIIEGEYACDEFAAINSWTVTEKVDGTNVRIVYERGRPDLGTEDRLSFLGRTSNAQFPTFLYAYLSETFTIPKMDAVFPGCSHAILFGEGFGPKIQSGGYYSSSVAFILFDVFAGGWWLKRESIGEIGINLGIQHCPLIGNPVWTRQEIVDYVKSKPKSLIAKVQEHEMEGIVARSEPQMMFRQGNPIMFKLKCSDFK